MPDRRDIRNGAIIEFLKKLGYSYNSIAQEKIRQCNDWYANNKIDFHQRTNLNGVNYRIEQMNFAKRCCADDANLCEVVEINAGSSESQFEGVLEILSDSKFDTMYRKQLEKMSACGTVGCYIRLDDADHMTDGTVKNGTIRLNYAEPDCIIPLTVINDDILECGFAGKNLVSGKDEYVLVIFVLDENGRYMANTYYFNEDGKNIPEKETSIQLGEIKPFAIMRTAEVNNLDDMIGYGYPKLYNSIPILKCLDLAYNILFGDLDKGEKLVFINELLAEVKKDVNGMPEFTPSQKRTFILMGNKLGKEDDKKTLIQEYNPELRIEEITKIFETCLSILSMSFGYGTKKYTFEGGQIKTATEYIGQKQDAMQELNKQRFEAKQYITDICRAAMWFSNQFHGTAWNLDGEVCIEFDDSYITDKQTDIETMRADAISFPEVNEFKIQYIMLRLNCNRDEAVKYIEPEQAKDNPLEE